MPLRIGRRHASVELRDADHGVLAGLAEQVASEARDIVLPVIGLLELDTRGHVQQRADRRLAVLGTCEPGDVGRDLVVDGFDCPVGRRNSDQHCGDGLRHRLGEKAIVLRSRVLIVFVENCVIPSNQQPRRRLSVEIIHYFTALAAEGVGDLGLGGSLKRPG